MERSAPGDRHCPGPGGLIFAETYAVGRICCAELSTRACRLMRQPMLPVAAAGQLPTAPTPRPGTQSATGNECGGGRPVIHSSHTTSRDTIGRARTDRHNRRPSVCATRPWRFELSMPWYLNSFGGRRYFLAPDPCSRVNDGSGRVQSILPAAIGHDRGIRCRRGWHPDARR